MKTIRLVKPKSRIHHRQILLGYLSADRSEWSETLAKKRQIYEQFVAELVLNEQSNTQTDDHVSERPISYLISGIPI